MDAPPARGSENLGSLWQSTSRPLCLRRQLSLPNLFYKNHGYPGPRMAQPSVLYFPPSRSATAGTRANQGTTAQADSNSPLWRNQTPLPFWQAMAGCIAIGSLTTAMHWLVFLFYKKTITCSCNCVIQIGFS